MGDVRQASNRMNRIFEERAEEQIADEYEKEHGEISDYDAFLKAHYAEIDDRRMELMSEAGFE